jgi:hypothetical protein
MVPNLSWAVGQKVLCPEDEQRLLAVPHRRVDSFAALPLLLLIIGGAISASMPGISRHGVPIEGCASRRSIKLF